jgi:ABC-type sugar transport system ATPase subunit
LAAVSIQTVRKVFTNETIAVDDVSLEVADGEFLVLLGPSGCGKTTVLRMIAGLETATSGEILIGGRTVTHLHPADRDVAMVFQSYALYPHMSVYKNLAYGLKRRGMRKAEIARQVTEAAELLEIGPLLKRLPAQLSGGQRQRVALGRAIVRHPTVFLLDEPLSNLDAKLRVQMRNELMRLHRRLGVTTIYVTHDQVEAMTMGERIVVMNSGRVQQIGSPLALFEQPRNRFVATFLGTPQMNELRGRLEGGGFHAAGISFPVEVGGADGPLDVVLGIRPQHLWGTPEPPGQDRIRLGRATVEFIEHLGPESFAFASLAELTLAVEVEAGRQYAPGDELELSIPSGKIHVFDAATGERLPVSLAAPATDKGGLTVGHHR